MRYLGLSVLIVSVCLNTASSADTPESLRAVSAEALSGALEGAPAAFKASRNVRLSGNVRLDGNGYAPNGNGYAHVSLSGWASVRGADGVQSGQFTVRHTAGVFVNENRRHYSEYVRVSENVPIYKDGRYIGSAWITGSIWVSGWMNGNWLHLSGSGPLDGSIFLRDEEPQPPQPPQAPGPAN